jgi:hypothetical protein
MSLKDSTEAATNHSTKPIAIGSHVSQEEEQINELGNHLKANSSLSLVPKTLRFELMTPYKLPEISENNSSCSSVNK